MLSDPPRKPNERRTKALLGLALLIAAGLTFVANGRQMLDDAYIHLRYAWQLLHEHRLEYNPGQPSAGSSAVGYTLLLAALGAPLPRDWWPAMVQASSVTCLLKPAPLRRLSSTHEKRYFSCDGVSLTHAYRRTGHVVMNSNQYQRQSALTMYLWAPVSVPVR